jgi:hypothetical protein
MSPKPQHLAHDRIQGVKIAVTADGEDGVVGAAAAQCAVAQLGCQRCVPAGEPALREQLRKQQVRIGVPVGHGQQHVERYAPSRIGRPGRLAWLTPAARLTPAGALSPAS